MQIFVLVPLFLSVLFICALAKLAARILKRTQLSWLHAGIYSIVTVVLGGAGAIAKSAINLTGSLAFVAALIGIAIQFLFGGWYFSKHATTSEGKVLPFKTGILLTILVFLLIVAVGIIAGVGIHILLNNRNA